MTRKTLLIAVGLMAVVGLTFGFAGTALAYPGVSYTAACSGCHSGAATNPVATLVSNNGTTATYTVSSGGTEWALFNGSARVTGAPGATGQFAVPVGPTYTLFAVNGSPGGGTAQGLGVTSVTPDAPHFAITATATAGGTMTPSGSISATQGANVTYTFAASLGYHLATVTVDGVAQAGPPNSYTFTNVQAVHSISVAFVANPAGGYTITATAGANGTISHLGNTLVMGGQSLVYTMEPAEGYQVATITVDGVPLPATAVAGSPTRTSGWYTFLNVVATHTIDVSFQPNPPGWFTITPYAGDHGEIWMATETVQATSTVGSTTTVVPGVDVAVSITPEAGYHVASVTVDGLLIAPTNYYIFYDVRAGHTIAATFAKDIVYFGITASAGPNGSIAPTGTASVAQGDNATYTITPNAGYHIDSLTVDGSAVATATSYTFTNVQATHTIAVAFAQDVKMSIPTALTIKSSATSIKLGKAFNVSGLLNGAPGANGLMVTLMVKKPGKSFYSYSSNRLTYGAGAASSLWQNNNYKPTAKGVYSFYVTFAGSGLYLAAPNSAVIKVTVK